MHHPGNICGGSSPKVASPDMSPEMTGSREPELEMKGKYFPLLFPRISRAFLSLSFFAAFFPELL
jgi:hypothetical protein